MLRRLICLLAKYATTLKAIPKQTKRTVVVTIPVAGIVAEGVLVIGIDSNLISYARACQEEFSFPGRANNRDQPLRPFVLPDMLPGNCAISG